MSHQCSQSAWLRVSKTAAPCFSPKARLQSLPGGILQGQVCLKGRQRTWKSATALRTPSQHPLEPGSHISYHSQKERRPWRQYIFQVPPQHSLWRHSYLDYCSSWIKWCIKNLHYLPDSKLGILGELYEISKNNLDKKLITESSSHSQVALPQLSSQKLSLLHLLCHKCAALVARNSHPYFSHSLITACLPSLILAASTTHISSLD